MFHDTIRRVLNTSPFIAQTLGIPAILLTIIALIAFILNIVSASFCCMLNTAMGMPACCCCGGGGVSYVRAYVLKSKIFKKAWKIF